MACVLILLVEKGITTLTTNGHLRTASGHDIKGFAIRYISKLTATIS